MKFASVILDIPTQALDAPYTYAVPDAPVEAGGFDVEVGCAVLVPFGHRQAVGFVVAVEDCDEGSAPAGLDPSKVKPIVRAVSHAYFDEEGAACAQWLSERYLAPLSSCVRLFTPPGGVPRMVRAREGYWRLEEPTVGEVDDRWVLPGPAFAGFEPRKNAVKQASIVEALRAGELRVAELTAEFGAVSSPLKALEKQGVVRIEHRRRMRGFQVPRVPPACRPPEPADAAASPGTRSRGDAGDFAFAVPSACQPPELLDAAAVCGTRSSRDPGSSRTEVRFAPAIPRISGTTDALADSLRQPAASVQPVGDQPAAGFIPSPKPPLTAGQASALAAIDAARERGAGEVVLVDGVTGSGKTEVYLQAIEAALAAGRTACVLVPEISLTPQTVGRFRGRFGDTVAVMHSRMSAGERYDQWDFIRSGTARVVVGARSALFTPLANVGLIVIDEEHEGSYKQDSAPRYHARDVAVWMARRAGAAVVLGTATPSIEALYACAKDPLWHHVELPERANGRPLPAVQVVDMAVEFGGGSRSMFSGALSRALAEELSAGRKAVLLLNQRGFAKFLLCRECGFVPECPSCSTSLTFHERGNFLVCHHCGHRIAAPPVCPECGSPYLKKFGAGTQRVEADLRVLLDATPGVGPEVPIVRMDADTTSGKGAHQRLLEEFAAADAAVLLGTQMIAKGLDFEDVTLVGVINADTMLRLPDYRASERTFALVEQVAGRAGRAALPGRVLVQTYEADAAPIRAAAAYDRALFLRDELPKRKMLRYPPYVRMANVLVWGKEEEAVRRSAAALYEGVAAHVRDFAGEGWDVLPATPCVLAKLRGTYRWHLVVKCPLEGDLSGVLLPFFRARKPERDVNVAVDVDPDDLL
ncbi:replication restart helicase PriA [Gordonibacter massiliensis (ex Traore et al. 2017)]|uniref:Replication restart protein PriA n=1 Tax=Gordonibacter massiliensis (ex Traore et al. 2017) TaxID=1841863 RepID=A0A842JDW2_9ACTN|nr:primosomal protein N' [Gordonibacter massiliensis (ex Traore et al. 2017)]MBC2890193.1 primosomal protein N' [Gordonibacter massiliensis (ex Traore et al. 2017)]